MFFSVFHGYLFTYYLPVFESIVLKSDFSKFSILFDFWIYKCRCVYLVELHHMSIQPLQIP